MTNTSGDVNSSKACGCKYTVTHYVWSKEDGVKCVYISSVEWYPRLARGSGPRSPSLERLESTYLPVLVTDILSLALLEYMYPTSSLKVLRAEVNA